MPAVGAAHLWRFLLRQSGGASRSRPLVFRLAGGGLVAAVAAPAWLSRPGADDDAQANDWGVRGRIASDGDRRTAPSVVDGTHERQRAAGVALLSGRTSDDDGRDAARESSGRVDVRIEVRREPMPGERPGFATCARIAGANVAVYMGWWLLPESVMTSWFTSSAVEAYVRPWKGLLTALTSSFSHREFWHLGFNMLALMSFGPALVDGPYRHGTSGYRLTASELLRFYVSAGVLAGVASMAFNIAIRSPQRSLGASGALFAVAGYYTMTHPDSRVLLFFVFEMPAMVSLHLFNGLNAFLVYRAYAAARKGLPGPMFDGMAHLAGTGVGVAYYLAKAAAAPAPSSGGGSRSGGAPADGIAGRRPRVIVVPEPGPSVPVRRTHPTDNETDV